MQPEGVEAGFAQVDGFTFEPHLKDRVAKSRHSHRRRPGEKRLASHTYWPSYGKA
jgi:hypothetical protein